MDIKRALEALDFYLLNDESSQNYHLVIGGGAAMNLLNISHRETEDIDVFTPRILGSLKEATKAVASKLSIEDDWLNNGINFFKEALLPGWSDRLETVYTGEKIKVSSVSRIDLISLKFISEIHRESDIMDIKKLCPTIEELTQVANYVKKYQLHLVNDRIWHKEVDHLVSRITKE
jgi:hypothetical protein